MKRILGVCGVAVLAVVCGGWAGAQQVVPVDVPSQGAIHANGQGVEVLSDTQGVDFQPYLKVAMRQIYEQWVRLLPDGARAPENKHGLTAIRITIHPDGTIAAVHLEGSTQDEALNRAAWGAVTGVGHFAALPKEFHGPDLELRIQFKVNES
ncbi:MAG: TonB family protein [Acidobacteriaceae bacterium]